MEDKMKKQIVKRILAAVLAGVMLTGLAACGGADTSSGKTDADNGAAEQTDNAETKEADASLKSAEDVTVEWFSSVTGWGPSGWTSGVASSPLMDAIK